MELSSCELRNESLPIRITAELLVTKTKREVSLIVQGNADRQNEKQNGNATIG